MSPFIQEEWQSTLSWMWHCDLWWHCSSQQGWMRGIAPPCQNVGGCITIRPPLTPLSAAYRLFRGADKMSECYEKQILEVFFESIGVSSELNAGRGNGRRTCLSVPYNVNWNFSCLHGLVILSLSLQRIQITRLSLPVLLVTDVISHVTVAVMSWRKAIRPRLRL